jgi:hypothetical protein
VLRVPLANGVAWFKACGPVQAFEARRSAALFARWPDRVAQVLGHDQQRAWRLVADAGTPIGVVGNPPPAWLVALPLDAQLQRGEASHATSTWPTASRTCRWRRCRHATRSSGGATCRWSPAGWVGCAGSRRALSGCAANWPPTTSPETVRHDDLHMANLDAKGERRRLLDWGDASVAHPFGSLVVTFWFLEQRNQLPPADRGWAAARRLSGAVGWWGGGVVGWWAGRGGRGGRAGDPRRGVGAHLFLGAAAGLPAPGRHAASSTGGVQVVLRRIDRICAHVVPPRLARTLMVSTLARDHSTWSCPPSRSGTWR